MLTLRGALLGVTLLAASSVAATGADLGEHNEVSKPVSTGAAHLYLRGDLGFAWNSATEISEHDQRMSDVIFGRNTVFGGGVGWYVSPHWRVDMTLEQRTDLRAQGVVVAAVAPAVGNPAGIRRFDVSSTMAMANLYYDFTSRDGFDPYLGVGLGWVTNSSHNGGADVFCNNLCDTYIDDAHQTNVAWSLMAGFTQPVARGFTLDAGYRLSDLGGAQTGNLRCCLSSTGGAFANTDRSTTNIYAHEFHIGLRYDVY